MFFIVQVKPSTPVTTINTQTCRYPPTVPLACLPSIPHSCPQSQTLGSTAMWPLRLALAWQPTLPSPRWYQTSTALQPNSILPVQTAQHLSISPARAKTPTFPPWTHNTTNWAHLSWAVTTLVMDTVREQWPLQMSAIWRLGPVG